MYVWYSIVQCLCFFCFCVNKLFRKNNIYIYIQYISTYIYLLIYFLYSIFSHVSLFFFFIFIYFYYECKGIPLIDAFYMYPRMLLVDKVCNHSYIFSNPSVQNHWVAPRLTQPFILLRSVK